MVTQQELRQRNLEGLRLSQLRQMRQQPQFQEFEQPEVFQQPTLSQAEVDSIVRVALGDAIEGGSRKFEQSATAQAIYEQVKREGEKYRDDYVRAMEKSGLGGAKYFNLVGGRPVEVTPDQYSSISGGYSKSDVQMSPAFMGAGVGATGTVLRGADLSRQGQVFVGPEAPQYTPARGPMTPAPRQIPIRDILTGRGFQPPTPIEEAAKASLPAFHAKPLPEQFMTPAPPPQRPSAIQRASEVLQLGRERFAESVRYGAASAAQRVGIKGTTLTFPERQIYRRETYVPDRGTRLLTGAIIPEDEEEAFTPGEIGATAGAIAGAAPYLVPYAGQILLASDIESQARQLEEVKKLEKVKIESAESLGFSGNEPEYLTYVKQVQDYNKELARIQRLSKVGLGVTIGFAALRGASAAKRTLDIKIIKTLPSAPPKQTFIGGIVSKGKKAGGQVLVITETPPVYQEVTTVGKILKDQIRFLKPKLTDKGREAFGIGPTKVMVQKGRVEVSVQPLVITQAKGGVQAARGIAGTRKLGKRGLTPLVKLEEPYSLAKPISLKDIPKQNLFVLRKVFPIIKKSEKSQYYITRTASKEGIPIGLKAQGFEVRMSQYARRGKKLERTSFVGSPSVRRGAGVAKVVPLERSFRGARAFLVKIGAKPLQGRAARRVRKAKGIIFVKEAPQFRTGAEKFIGKGGRARPKSLQKLQQLAASAAAKALAGKAPKATAAKTIIEVGKPKYLSATKGVSVLGARTSDFYGKGLYEKTDEAVFGIPKAPTRERVITIPRTIQIPRTRVGARERVELGKVFVPRPMLRGLSIETPRQPQRVVSVAIPIQRQRLRQSIRQPQRPRQRITPIQPITPRPPRRPTSVIPKIDDDFIKKPTLRKKPKEEDGFIPYLRRFGKFFPISKPTTFRQAFTKGQERARKTLGASFFITRKGKTQPIPFGKGFRPSKISPFVAVQIREQRLSDPFEVAEIVRARRGSFL